MLPRGTLPVRMSIWDDLRTTFSGAISKVYALICTPNGPCISGEWYGISPAAVRGTRLFWSHLGYPSRTQHFIYLMNIFHFQLWDDLPTTLSYW